MHTALEQILVVSNSTAVSGQPGWSVRATPAPGLLEGSHCATIAFRSCAATVPQRSVCCSASAVTEPGGCCSAPAVLGKKCESEGRRLLSRTCAGMRGSSARRHAQETAFRSAECTRAPAVAARGGRFQGTALCSAECVLACAAAVPVRRAQGTAFCSAGAVTGFCPSSTSLPWVLGLWTVLSGV